MLKLLGVTIPRISKNELRQTIDRARRPLFMVTLNPEILLRAWNDEAYQNIINGADIKVADGVGVVIMARVLYGVTLERIAGADLAEEFVQRAAKKNKTVFLLGGSKTANERAIKRIMKYEVRIRGLGGNFSYYKAKRKILAFKPHIVLVALGVPKQEIFIHRFLQANSHSLQGVLIGVGGTIDFWAYPRLRAPYIVRRLGLEWTWRLIMQPWRIGRITKAVILFPLACLWEFALIQLRDGKK